MKFLKEIADLFKKKFGVNEETAKKIESVETDAEFLTALEMFPDFSEAVKQSTIAFETRLKEANEELATQFESRIQEVTAEKDAVIAQAAEMKKDYTKFTEDCNKQIKALSKTISDMKTDAAKAKPFIEGKPADGAEGGNAEEIDKSKPFSVDKLIAATKARPISEVFAKNEQ